MQQAPSPTRYLLSWLTLFRLGATARGVLPFLLGAVIAWSQGNPINLAVLVLSSLGVIFVMLMTFLVNEYYDYEGDILNKEFHRLSGGSRVLPMGLVSRRHSLIAAYVLLFLTGIIGLVLQFYRGKHRFIRKHYGTFPLLVHRILLAKLLLLRLGGAYVRKLWSGGGALDEEISVLKKGLAIQMGASRKQD